MITASETYQYSLQCSKYQYPVDIHLKSVDWMLRNITSNFWWRTWYCTWNIVLAKLQCFLIIHLLGNLTTMLHLIPWLCVKLDAIMRCIISYCFIYWKPLIYVYTLVLEPPDKEFTRNELDLIDCPSDYGQTLDYLGHYSIMWKGDRLFFEVHNSWIVR